MVPTHPLSVYLPSLYEKFGGKQEKTHLQVSMMHLIMYSIRTTSKLPALKKKKEMKQAAHTLLGVLFIFPEFHLLRRQNPVCPHEPFRQRSSGSNQKSKRSHSSPALGEFQNQGVRVRIPFPARVQFLNKTQGNGIPLGKSGHSSSTITSGSTPGAEGLALGAATPAAGWQDDAEAILGARHVPSAAGEKIQCGQPPAARPP